VRRFRIWAGWLAILALLIDGLLPTAVSAATGADMAVPAALCSAASGAPQPAKHQSPLPPRHCALCGACAAGLPPEPPRRISVPLIAEDASSAIALSTAPFTGRPDYPPALPRAPPASR
jgi:hypothetical protein